jgi:hypothetical protein
LIDRIRSDWYPLLDLCGYKNCLIADRDGVYDPGTPNGRLLLGLKGQISEMELHTLRLRLTAGLLNKAQRGDLALTLPVGLVRQPDDSVVKDSDREVQQRVALVFTTFLEQRSAAQALRTLREQGLSLPRRDRFGTLVWRPPSLAAIIGMLRNPAYAGAFVYGRTRSERLDSDPQVCRPRTLPMSEWKICVRDKYPAYIDWSTFERIQAMLRDNYAEYDRNKTRGIPRPGKALLQGLVYCGQCGHKMVLQYKDGARYQCNYIHQHFGGPVCQHLPAAPVDAQVLKAFFAALSPLELDAYTEARAAQAKTQRSVIKAQDQQLQRLRYQAALAERQFLQVDPDNRLVAAELESRWEQALQVLAQAEARQHAVDQTNSPQANDIAPELREAFTELGQRLPTIWDQGLLRRDQQKALLRCLIDKVVVHRARPDQVHLRIVWKGELISTFDVPVAVGALADYSQAAKLTERVLALFDEKLTDEEIASQLTTEGLRSPRHERVVPSTVKVIRLRHGRMVLDHQSHPRHVPGFLTVAEVAKVLAVPPHWLYGRIYNGAIRMQRDPITRLYLFPDKPSTITQLRQLHDGLLKDVRFSPEHQDD